MAKTTVAKTKVGKAKVSKAKVIKKKEVVADTPVAPVEDEGMDIEKLFTTTRETIADSPSPVRGAVTALILEDGSSIVCGTGTTNMHSVASTVQGILGSIGKTYDDLFAFLMFYGSGMISHSHKHGEAGEGVVIAGNGTSH